MKKLEWSSLDAANLKVFLDSDSGKRFLLLVRAFRPNLLDGQNPDQTLVQSGVYKGYVTLSEMITEDLQDPDFLKPETEQETYPDLDNDKKWVEQQ